MRGGIFKLLAGAFLLVLLSYPPAGAQRRDYRVMVVNDTNFAVEYFYFSRCATNDWGHDRLGRREIIDPGGQRVFDMYDGIDDCCRDMRAVFASQAARQRLGVDVCRESKWVLR
jgi:hypothetical protein